MIELHNPPYIPYTQVTLSTCGWPINLVDIHVGCIKKLSLAIGLVWISMVQQIFGDGCEWSQVTLTTLNFYSVLARC